MSRKLVNIGFVLIALAFCVRPILSQEKKMYVDGADRFQIPVPELWTNKSDDTHAHFVNADGTAEIYALVLESDDLQTGVQAVLEQVYPGFPSSPMQTTDIPLPGGKIWTQNIYMLTDGNLLAAVARVEGHLTYVVTLHGSQNALMQATPTFNQILLGHTLMGAASAELPEYVDRSTFTEQEMSIGPKEASLPATLTLPNGDGPFPVVVIVHGSGPANRDGTVGINRPYRDIAQGLASSGVAVLRYDKRTLVYPD